MAEMTVERTAEGQALVYRMCIHPEVFELMDHEELVSAMTIRFEELLADTLREMRGEEEEE